MTSLKEETYLLEHKVVDRSLTNAVPSSGLLTDLVRISTTYQQLLKTSPPSDDKSQLVGYIHKWSQSKILVGCALYMDILKPPSLLSHTLQDDKLDLVLGIKHILKTIKSLKALAGQDPLQRPTVKLVCSKIKDEDGSKQYQGALLQCYDTRTLEHCKEQALADLKQLDLKMRDRLEWSDVKLLRSILLFCIIDTQGWQVKSSSTDTGMLDSDMMVEKTIWTELSQQWRISPQHSEFLLRLKGLTYRPFMMKLKKLSTMQEGTSLLTRYATRKSGTSYIPHLILANGQTFS